ncbi:MAG: DNA polymerase III subunit delta' [Pseudomonadota bacterium]
MTDMDQQSPPEPRENSFLAGHQRAEERLLQAFESNRLPHAWLISGPRGIGKATLAFRFARFVLAGGGARDMFGAPAQGLAIDESDQVFRWVASESHADMMTLRRRADEKGRLPASISVEETRKVISFLHMTSSEGGWRVVVVDAVDDMTRNAANALLKALEEPPARSLMLLVCHGKGAVLPTIRSRCCDLPLSALSTADLDSLLARYDRALEPADRSALSALSDGSIGRALTLHRNGSLDLFASLLSILKQLPDLKIQSLHELGDRLARGTDGEAFRSGHELLLWWLARLVRAGASGVFPQEVMPGESETMRRLLATSSPTNWLTAREALAALFRETEAANLDKKQAVINGLQLLSQSLAKA